MPDVPRVAVTLTQCWHRVPGGTATSVLDLVDAVARTGAVDPVGVGPRIDVADPTPPVPRSTSPRLSLPLAGALRRLDRCRGGRRSSRRRDRSTSSTSRCRSRRPSSAAPLVATVHDLFPLTMPEQFTGRGARLMRAGLDQIRSRARIVAVPSSAVAATARRTGSIPIGCAWCRGALPSSTPKQSIEPRSPGSAALRPERTLVLFVGTLEPRKGLATLVAAMARLDRPDVTLAIAGPDGWGTDLDVLVAGVASPVARLGFVPGADLPALERAADAFCYPSVAEGFGLPVLEAMAAGAAVVTTAGTSMAEVAGDAARLAPAGDARGARRRARARSSTMPSGAGRCVSGPSDGRRSTPGAGRPSRWSGSTTRPSNRSTSAQVRERATTRGDRWCRRRRARHHGRSCG